jgi:hypothetical protein
MIYSRQLRLSSWSDVNMRNAVMRGIVVFCLALVLIEAALQYVGMTSKSASDSSQYHALQKELKTSNESLAAAQTSLQSTKDGPSSS